MVIRDKVAFYVSSLYATVMKLAYIGDLGIDIGKFYIKFAL